MRPFATWLTGGWQSISFGETPEKLGYYVHRGRLYVTGIVANRNQAGVLSPVTPTILHGLPKALRPKANTKILVPSLSQDTHNPATNLKRIWHTTVRVNGTWTIDDELPPQVSSAPTAEEWHYVDNEGEHPQYLSPVELVLLLGNASWPVTALADTYTTKSLAAFLGAEDFEDIDSGYAVHGNRLHLAGTVRARKEGAEELLAKLPPGTFGGYDATTTVSSGHGLVGGQMLPLEGGPERRFLLLADTVAEPLAAGSPLEFPNRNYLGPGVLTASQAFNAGEVQCSCPAPLPKDPPIKYRCQRTESVPPLALDLGQFAEACSPPPDWFLLLLSASLSESLTGNKDMCDCGTYGCGGILPYGEPNFTIRGGDPRYGDGSPYGTKGVNPIVAYLKPPASLYAPPPYPGPKLIKLIPASEDYSNGNVNPSLLWAPAQLAGVVSMLFNGTEGTRLYQGAVHMSIKLLPVYPVRRFVLKAGDVLDLGKAGWELPASELTIGPGERGKVIYNP